MKLYVLVLLLVILLVQDEVFAGWRRRRRRCNIVNCAVSGWSSWGGCNHQCGSTGIQTRTRTKTVVEQCTTCPYLLTESQACNRGRCQNRGRSIPGRCQCTPRWTGTCCEIDLRGPIGVTGQQGIQGQKGSRGFPGQTGSPGQKGNAGLKGDQGQRGLQGQPGKNGPQGPKGEQGQKGNPGSFRKLKCRRVTRRGKRASCRFGERVFGCYSVRGCRGARPDPSLSSCRNYRTRCATYKIMAVCCK